MAINIKKEHRKYLEMLEFSDTEINALRNNSPNKEAFIRKVSKKWRMLSLKLHPDKNPNDANAHDKFIKITAAYQALSNHEDFQPNGLDFIVISPRNIDIGSIDQYMEEQIDGYYEHIINESIHLNDEAARENFAKKHTRFINLAKWLEKNREKIYQYRLEEFKKKTESPSLSNTLYQDWNKLIVTLFAKEALDDITYREAIALGEYLPILSFYKLMSPIKWLSLLINGAYHFITTILLHLNNRFIQNLCSGVINLQEANQRTLLNIAILSLKFIAAITCGILPLYLIPTNIFLMLLTLPLLNKILFSIANPINQIITPLAEYFDTSPLYITLAAVALLLMAATSLSYFIVLNSAFNLTICAINLLGVGNLLCTLYLCKNIYDINPVVGTFFLAYSLISMGLSPSIAIENLTQALTLLLGQMGLLGINITTIKFMSNLSNETSHIFSQLPMPSKAINSCDKRTVLEGVQKTNYSHALFNTRADITVNSTNKQSNGHKACSFFGLNKKSVHKEENDTQAKSFEKKQEAFARPTL